MAALVPMIPWVAASLISIFGNALLNKIKKSEEEKKIEKLAKQICKEKSSDKMDAYQAEQRDILLAREIEERQERQRLFQTHRAQQELQKKLLQEKLAQLNLILENVRKELEQHKQKAIKANDPKMFREAKKAIFNSFLENLKVFQFKDQLKKNENNIYHIVMGLTSVGKSSLLKKVTGAKLKIGKGETTVGDAVQIGNFEHENFIVNVFDSPGINQDFSCYDIKTLTFLYQMDEVFIIYKDSIKNSTELLRIMNTIRKQRKLILVRTQCDLFDEEDQRTCEEEIQVDRAYMEELGIPCEILAFSSKKGKEFMDNEKVQKMIKGEFMQKKQ